ncbi:MAG: response regulator [Chryseolinea sp.]
MMQRVINILLVEDDRLDQMEVQRTLERKGIVHRLKIALNGEEALTILDESRANHNRPDLILVDLNMPKMNGFEFLEKVRSIDEFKDIKLFVLSTSDDKEDKMAEPGLVYRVSSRSR